MSLSIFPEVTQMSSEKPPQMHPIDKHSWHFTMLFRFENILGLNPLKLGNDSTIKSSPISLFYALLQTITFGFVCVEVFLDRYRVTAPSETEIFFILDQQIVVLTFLELSSCWISFALAQKQLLDIVDHFKKLILIEHRLDVICDYDKFIRYFAISVSCFNVFFLCSVTYTMWVAARMTPEGNLKWWCTYNVTRVTHYNMILLFAATIAVFILKFRRLNTQLGILLIGEECDGPQFFRILSKERVPLNDELSLFSELHRETCGLLKKIVSYFTIPLLITITSDIIHITANIYCYYLYLEDHRPKNWDIFYVLSVAHWIAFPIAAVVIISDSCGRVISEAQRTSTILHSSRLPDNSRAEHVRMQFNLFSLQLLRNDMQVTLFGLCDVNHCLLVRMTMLFLQMTCSMVTCLVIIVQFGEDLENN